ncbi:MAG TPA: hypothetical protein VF260_11130 [Bacilli bacterium]
MTATFPTSASENEEAIKHFSRLSDAFHPISKDDCIWALEYVKKKVAEEDPNLLGLSQPRLLKNFSAFADAALTLLSQTGKSEWEAENLRRSVLEAAFGIRPV